MNPSLRSFLLLLAALLISFGTACNKRFIKRTDYVLEKHEELLVSDSPTLAEIPERASDTELKFKQALLLENKSRETTYKVRFEEASFTIDNETFKSICKPFSDKLTASISPGNKERIDCITTVKTTTSNRLAIRDVVGTLHLPISGKSSFTLTFKYNLSAEDFE